MATEADDPPGGCVLVVEDEEAIREGLVRALRGSGLEVVAAPTLAAARAAFATHACDCILLDVRLPDGDGLDLLAEVRATDGAPPVVVATSFDDGERIIRAMRLGAHDYVTKPFDLAQLRQVVRGAARAHALARRIEPPGAPDDRELVGRAPAMRAVWKAIGRAAATDAPVLVTGPTGSGKEVVARAIHRHSRRAGGPFVAVNLAGLAPSLIESELFGHERGAFTGAAQRRKGRVEAASGGTLFLDEIGDLEPSLQTKLLRLLQDRSFERVGGTDTLVADVRFVAATLAPVKPGAEGARLRQDLYYRLAVLEIEVPPLAARREDLPLLVRHGVERARARGISEEALALLCAREWPGNVRELLHVVERAAALAGAEVIDARHLPQPTPQASSFARALAEQLGSLTMREAVALVEQTMVTVALERTAGNRSRAARLLGIGRPLLYAKMREHGITSAAPPDAEEDDGADR
jgi:DNA-binding NtrC family response regulator